MATRKMTNRKTNGYGGRRTHAVALATAAFAGMALVLPAITPAATTDTWIGTSGIDMNWGTSGNWTTTNPGGIPLTDDLLSFGGTTNLTSTDNISGLTISGLNFVSGAGAFVLNKDGSSDPLTLDSLQETTGGTLSGGNITNSNGASGTAETINVPITFTGGDHTVTTSASSGQLTFGGTMTASTGATVQFTVSGGVINVTNAGLSNDGTTGVMPGWATVGTNLATINGSGNVVAYNSYTSESGNFTAALNTNYKITANNGTLTIAPEATTTTADLNSIVWAPSSNHSETVESSVAANPIRLGAHGVIMNTNAASAGTLTVGGGNGYSLTAGGGANAAGAIYVYDLTSAGVPYTSGNVNLNSKITDNGSATYPVSLNVFGSVNIGQNVVDTYTGGTYNTEGELFLNSGSSLGSGPVYIYNGGRVDYGSENGVTVANNFFISGYGFVAGNDPDAIKGTFNGTFSGSFTLLANAAIDPNAGGGTNTCTFSGPINGTGSLTIGGSNTHLVAGTATLGGANSYSGDLIIDASANQNGGSGVKFSSGISHNNLMAIGGNVDLIGGTSGIATFDLNGTTQTINGLTTPSGTLANALVTSTAAGGVLTVGNNGANATFGGVIAGGANLGLTKTGAGTQALTGANTYTGSTTVNNGTLSIGGSLAAGSAVSVNNNGTLLVTNGGAVNGSITVGGSAAMTLGVNSTDHETLAPVANSLSPSTPSISDAGTLTTNSGASTVTLNVGETSALTSGNEYALIGYNGSIGGTGTSAFTLGTLPARTTATLDFSHPGVIDLNVSAADFPVWTGAKDGFWVTSGSVTTGGTDDWVLNSNNATATDFVQGDNVLFNDNASVATTTIIISGANVQPGLVTFNNSSKNYTLVATGSFGIIGSGSLIKSGTGAVTIATTNTYSGGTILNAGTLNLGNAYALGTGPITINGGTIDNTSGTVFTLPSNNTQNWAGPFTFTGTKSLNLGTGLVTLTNNPVVTVTANTLTAGGVIGGSGQTLTKAGSGTLVLTANSSYSGGLTINNGTIQVNGTGGSTGLGSGNVTVNTGGVLVGAVSDAFGYQPALPTATNPAPNLINIAGGTVTDLGTSSYRVTLPNLTFTGGTLTSAVGNNGDSNGNYSLNGIQAVTGANACTVTTNATTTTAVINAGAISMQSNTTFNVAAGTVTTGPTPGVDLLISSPIVVNGSHAFTKQGAGVMEIMGADTFNTTTFTLSGGTLIVNSLANGGAASGIGISSNAATNLVINGGTLQYIGPAQSTDRLFTVGQNGATIDSSGTGPLNFTNTGTIPTNINGSSTLTLQGSNTGANTLAAVIPDSGTENNGLNKNGSGTWILSGASSYANSTNINGGILSITGSLTGGSTVTISSGGTLSGNGDGVTTGLVSGAVILNSGGAIDPGVMGPGTIGKLTLQSSLTVNGGNLNFDLGTATNDLLQSTSSVSLASASIKPAGGITGQSYTVLNTSASPGSITGTLPTLVQPNASISRITYSYDASSWNPGSNANVNSIIIDVAGGANLTWNNNNGGSGDGATWDIVGNQNWNSAASSDPYRYYEGDAVTFNDNNNGTTAPSSPIGTNANAYNVTLNETVNPASVTVSTNGAYTISGTGAIAGAAALSMTSPGGGGSLTLATSNSYGGGTVLNSGTLNINNASALGVGLLTINGGTIDNTTAGAITLSTNNPQTWVGSFAFTGTKSLNLGTGPVTLSNNITVTANANTLTVGGVISGTGFGLIKAGNGTLVLTANNAYTGQTTVNGGTLTLSGTNSPNSTISTSSGLVVNNNGTVNFTVDNALAGSVATLPITINAGGLITQSGANSAHIRGTLTLAGGTLATTGAPSGTGTTFGTYDFDNTVVAGGVTATSTISAQGIILSQAGGTIFNVASGATSGIDLNVTGTFSHTSADNGLIKQGTGVMALAGANTYTGGTTLNQGTLDINNAAALGASTSRLTINALTTPVTIDNTTAAPITLANNNVQTWASSFTFTGTENLNMGSGAVTLNSNPTITVTNTATSTTGTLTVGGAIANGTGNSLTKAGNGTLILSAVNTFSGGLTINGGIVQSNTTGGTTSLGAGNVTVNTGGTLVGGQTDSFGYTNGSSPATINIAGGTVTDLPNANYRITLQDINFTGGTLTSATGATGDANGEFSLFAGTVESNAASTTAVISASKISLEHGSATFTVAQGTVPSGVDLLVSSVVANYNSTVCSVIKNGTGEMALSNANTYTGATTVNNGTLLVTNTTGSATGTGNVTVTGGSLGGTGTISGSVALNSGTTIFPGTAVAHGAASTLTVGPLTLSGANLDFSIGGTLGSNDLLAVNGAVSASGTDTINVAALTGLTSLATGDYTVITAGSGLGTSAFTLGSSTLMVGSNTYSLSLADSTSTSEIISIGGGGPANLFFTGSAANGNWDINSTTNWTPGSGAVVFHTGDNVTFDDTTGAGGHNTGQFTVAITSGGVVPGSMTVTGNTPYTFTGGNIGSGSSTSLTVASGAKMTVDRGAGSRITVELGSLSNSGTINLENNWLIVHNPNQTAADNTTAAIFTQLQNGFAGGTWAGGTSPSIISSGPNGAAGSSLYTLGEVESGTDVLVKYAYYGDADLTGHVDGTDYSQIDTGFGSQGGAHPLTGWQNGDFNYDGHIDGSDYSLIDNSFNTQLASAPAAQIAVNTSEIASGSAAVPEPASLGLLGIGAIGLMSRRRRRV
jgi:fibronectin-binding autotransporter adhesin